MEKKLLDHVADDLLELFGQGKPTPGSGSAAALQVLLSVKVVRSVNIITAKDTIRPPYEKWLPKLQTWNKEFDDRIYPELKELFQRDSDDFEKYIEVNRKWRREGDPKRREELNRQQLEKLAIVTNNAIAIAELSVELGEAAEFAFNCGFREVRGEAAVAVNGHRN